MKFPSLVAAPVFKSVPPCDSRSAPSSRVAAVTNISRAFVEPRTLVVIDAGVADSHQLVAGAVAGADVLLLDAQGDGVEQVTQMVYSDRATHLHLICHAIPGCLHLGNTQLSLETIAHYAPLLQGWFAHPESQLLLYGCNVAAGDAGSEFIDRLQQVMGVPIAASTTAIGSAALGGNWELDQTTGFMDVQLGFHIETLQRYPAVLAAGDLDPSFGILGRATFNTAGNDLVASTLIQPDGRMILVGSSEGAPIVSGGITQTTRDFTLMRLNSNGSLDSSFGTGGRVVTNIGVNDVVQNAILQADGKIVLVGNTNPMSSSGNQETTLVRYNPNGSLDTSFGSGGWATSIFASNGSFGSSKSIALQADGKLVVTGIAADMTIARYNSNGSLDLSFGNGGRTTSQPALSALAASMDAAVQPDGKIVVVGRAYGQFTRSDDLALVRYNTDGSFDSSFGVSGLVTTDFLNGIDTATDVLIQPDGKILVAGTSLSLSSMSTFPVGTTYPVIARYNSNGSQDTTFGNGGRLVGSVFASEFILQPDGNFLVVGSSGAGDSSNFAVFRYTSNGSLDTTFGINGTVTTDFAGRADSATSIALQPDGRLVVAGNALTGTGNDFAIARYSNDAPLPTDTNLSQVIIAENLPASTTVGSFTSNPPTPGITYTYAIVPEIGNPDSTAFTIDGNSLRTTQSFNFEAKSTYNIVVRTNSNNGSTFDKVFAIGIADVNEAPVLAVPLQNHLGTVGNPLNINVRVPVNTFSDPDIGDFPTVSANLSNGNPLPTWLGFNLSSWSFFGTPGINDVGTYDIVVRAIDHGNLSATAGFTLTITSSNQAPTDLSLSSTTIAENLPRDTVVGTFTTTDPDPEEQFLYYLVAGSGSTDNASFRLVDNILYAASSFNVESQSSYSIRVRTLDGRGGIFEKPLTITVLDVNEAPVVAGAIANQTTTTGTPFSLVLPTSTFTDPDASDLLTLSLSATLGNGTALPAWLTFNPTTRTLSGTPGSGDAGSLTVLVRATDRGGLSTTTSFNLTINATVSNQAPTNLSLSRTSIAENLASGAIVGTFTTTDPNVGDTFTYSLVSGTGATDNAAFTIVGNTLRANQSFNFEAKSTYSIRVRTSDGKGGVFEKVLTIRIEDVNDAPVVAIPIPSRSATVGRSFRYTVPANTFFDEDANANDDLDWLTYSARLSNGNPLPSWLRFNANTLTFSGTPVAGNVGTLSIAVRATDSKGAWVSSTFTLIIQN